MELRYGKVLFSRPNRDVLCSRASACGLASAYADAVYVHADAVRTQMHGCVEIWHLRTQPCICVRSRICVTQTASACSRASAWGLASASCSDAICRMSRMFRMSKWAVACRRMSHATKSTSKSFRRALGACGACFACRAIWTCSVAHVTCAIWRMRHALGACHMRRHATPLLDMRRSHVQIGGVDFDMLRGACDMRHGACQNDLDVLLAHVTCDMAHVKKPTCSGWRMSHAPKSMSKSFRHALGACGACRRMSKRDHPTCDTEHVQIHFDMRPRACHMRQEHVGPDNWPAK